MGCVISMLLYRMTSMRVETICKDNKVMCTQLLTAWYLQCVLFVHWCCYVKRCNWKTTNNDVTLELSTFILMYTFPTSAKCTWIPRQNHIIIQDQINWRRTLRAVANDARPLVVDARQMPRAATDVTADNQLIGVTCHAHARPGDKVSTAGH